MTRLDIVYVKSAGSGWGPVEQMAHLAARLLGGTLVVVPDPGRRSAGTRIAPLIPRRRGQHRDLLFIVGHPEQLSYAARWTHWCPGYRHSAAWVVDSFWTDRLPRIARNSSHFDAFFVTDRELLDEWQTLTGKPAYWAPWGADTLVLDVVREQGRPTDLQRIGRQPDAWRDDSVTETCAMNHGLRFGGRPKLFEGWLANHRSVSQAMLRSKAVLAFNNLVDPAPYTHPTRDYVTGRWVDALAAGCTVVGAAPKSSSELLWPGATVEIDPHDLVAGMARVRDFVEAWTPEVSFKQHQRARSRLDWRHRISYVSTVMGWPRTESLEKELEALARPGGEAA